ncbi:MAG: hypothetical protein LBK95_11340 [Bifidobacteriaceae bacterium]|jgi:hypothetical protein|nr:hypothetical protein [Bifidobacteriaceae bacterium]
MKRRHFKSGRLAGLAGLAATGALALSGCMAVAGLTGMAGVTFMADQQVKEYRAQAQNVAEAVGKELAVYWTDATEPAGVLVEDGSVYFCWYGDDECVSEYNLITHLPEGVVSLEVEPGYDNSSWCAEVGYGDGQLVSVSASAGLKDGPC